MVYIVSNFLLLLMNIFRGRVPRVSPPIAQCVVPCFWGMALLRSAHAQHDRVIAVWHKSCTVIAFGVPAGILLAREGNIVAVPAAIFQRQCKIVSAILSHRVREVECVP